jgi:hypothetical protein
MRETGVGIRDPLFFIGVVENNVDERLEGRVQVRAFGVHGTNKQVPTESLPWATLIHGSYDPDAPIPPVNSFVFGFFIDGRDAQQPMILGLIPTQLLNPIDPELNGWGAIPSRNSDLLSRGSTPNDIGQPRISREARGEDAHNTYVAFQAANRRQNIPTASIDPDNEDAPRPTFSEPAPAYNTEYPLNRVIRSGRNSIELDDTPGSERITIYHHNSGSYIAIDTRGTTVYRSMSDTYDINERNHNVYIGGVSNVTIMGDSRVLVQGNKVEEITGDLIQNVRGNHLLSVAGQSNINVGEDIQMRGAKIRIEANVESVNIKANRDVKVETGEFIQMKSGTTANIEAADAVNINATDGNINIQSGADFNFKAGRAYITAEGALDLFGGHVKAGGGTKVSINADIVAIDDIIQLANGQSMPPEGAGDAGVADPAEGTEMPEPVSRGISVTAGQDTPSLGHSGYASTDEPSDPAADVELDDAVTRGEDRTFSLSDVVNLGNLGERELDPSEGALEEGESTSSQPESTFVPQQRSDRNTSLSSTLDEVPQQSRTWLTPTIERNIRSGFPGQEADIINAVNETAARIGASPLAVAALVNVESGFGTAYGWNSGTYQGATQVGRATFNDPAPASRGNRIAGITYDEYRNLSFADQIRFYPEWLNNYNFSNRFGDISRYDPATQYAVLQGFQFAPNGSTWRNEFLNGNYNVPSTRYQQARILGSTSVADMRRAYLSGQTGIAP